MPALWVIAIIVGLVLLFVGIGTTLKFLLYIGIIIAVVAIIGWIWRSLTGRKA